MNVRPSKAAIPDGAIEAIKWIALVLMTLDHVNKHLFQGAHPALFNAGRIVMPLFGIVLAYNLARVGPGEELRYRKVLLRLVTFGAVATVPYMLLGGLAWGWWPLNIMFTLAAAVFVLQMLAQGGLVAHAAAWSAFFLLGPFVEFWWPGMAVVVGGWALFTNRPGTAVAAFAAGLGGSLVLDAVKVTGYTNWWALAALPIVAVFARLRLKVPRLRWFFYVYYPAHLMAIWLLRQTTHPIAPLPIGPV